jgi:hypothetical protein
MNNLSVKSYHMKALFIAGLIVLTVSSCKQSEIRKTFGAADSLVIHFGDQTQITRTVQATEKSAIGRVADFIDAPETELYKCGYDGKMYFFTNGTVTQEVDFKMKDDSCRHFTFLLNGKLMATRMNNESADFLQALEAGLPVYW